MQNKPEILLIGGGGHCHSVIDVIEQEGKYKIAGIIDKKELEYAEFSHGKWCEKCSNSWYKGRLWFHEVLIAWEYLEPLIMSKTSSNIMREAAIENWMITITQDALLKAILWETTVEEALKLI